MRRRLLLACILLPGLWTNAFAGGKETVNQLRATRVQGKEIVIEIDETTLRASANADRLNQSLEAHNLFSASGDVFVTIENHAPLIWDIKVDATDLPDASAAAVDKLVEGLGAVIGVGEKPEGLVRDAKATPTPGCDELAALAFHLTQLEQKLSAPPILISGGTSTPISGDEIVKLAAKARGAAEVKRVAATYQAMGQQLADTAESVRGIVKEIKGLLAVKTACPDIATGTLASIVAVTFDGERRVARIETLSRALSDVADNLNKLKWTERGNYIAARAAVNKTIAISATRMALSVKPDGSIVRVPASAKDAQTLKGSFSLFEHHAPVVEIAGGPVWAFGGKKISTYSTKLKDGKTVISESKADVGFKATVMANILPRVGTASSVYPMFQLGASEVSGYPALLAGTGLRIIGKKHFGVAGGVVLFFPKVLDGKAVDDPIEGTDELQKHLKRTPQVTGYLGLQVAF